MTLPALAVAITPKTRGGESTSHVARGPDLVSRPCGGTSDAVPGGVHRSLAIRLALAASLAACAGTVDAGDGDGDGDPADVEILGPEVLPHVQELANVVCGSTGACTIGTRDGHHPTADRAIDILVSDAFGEGPADSNALGDEVAALALDHFGHFRVMYVIWRQRYNDGSGWDPMEDRGSITANHYDHVHVSFEE